MKVGDLVKSIRTSDGLGVILKPDDRASSPMRATMYWVYWQGSGNCGWTWAGGLKVIAEGKEAK